MHSGGGSSAHIPLSIDRLNDDNKNNVIWVLERFGRQVPTTAKYPFLKSSYIMNASELHSKNTVSKQIRWDQAWEWYDAYKSCTISFLEYRIQIREKELEKKEKNLKEWKQEIKPDRQTRRLIKSYERDIPDQKAEIAKLKFELSSLKTKEMQVQKQKQQDLSLENENLRLKKEILEIELKLKNFNKER